MATDPNDFTNAASDSGESIEIYNPSEIVDNDTESLTANPLGGGITENAIIQPEKLYNIQNSSGRLQTGDLFAMFISTSVITPNSQIKIGTKLYKVIGLEEVRPGGAVHHFECNLRFLRDTA